MSRGSVFAPSGLRFRCVPGAENIRVLEAFISAPQSIVAEGRVFKPGSRGFAVMADVAGRPCFIKHYRCLGWDYRLRNALRSSRAARTFAISSRFLALGIPVPAPFFWVEFRRMRLLGDSYLATEFIPSSVNLHEFWMGADPAARRAVLQCCVHIFSRMHAAGCCHGDLKWNNLLVRSGDPHKVVLVDLDGASWRPLLNQKRIEADLQRFIRDLNSVDQAGDYKRLFAAEWKRGIGRR